MIRTRTFLGVALATCLAGCGAPRDPAGTSARIQGGVLRVGVSENPPWVRFEGSQPAGIEPDLVREFAASQRAQVQWVRGGESRLLPDLEKYSLDLLVGGVTDKSPWAKTLGATQPYVEAQGEKHVWLTAPGENRFLLSLDRFLRERRAKAQSAVRAAGHA